jgi:hypothetical protein
VLRTIHAPRILLLLFSLVVTMNLTLICQGHDTSSGHLGPHVTLLFGSSHVHQVVSAVVAHSTHIHAAHTGHKQLQTEAAASHKPAPPTKASLLSAGPNTVGASQTAQVDGSGLAALGWVFLLFGASRAYSRRLPHPTEELLEPQASTAPDSPPPRISG